MPASTFALMQLQNYANGQWIAGTGKQSELLDASTGEHIATTSCICLGGHSLSALLRVVIFLLVSMFTIVGHGQDGQLDPTFATNGVLILDSNALFSSFNALAVDADGNYLGAGGRGSFTPDHYLSRVNEQGDPDASWGIGGTVVEPISNDDDFANDVLIQPDGKIVTVGIADSSLCISRFETNGSLDPSFGTGGRTLVSGSTGMAQGWAIARRPNGDLLAGGMLDNDQCLVQFNSDGILDPSFGSGGIATITAPTDFDRIEALAIRPDGRVITVGRAGTWSASTVVVAQFTTAGILDGSFATAGQLLLDLSPNDDTAEDILLLSDGSAVICGSSTFQGYIAQVTTAGALNAGFGDSGVSTIALGGDSLVPFTGLAVQSDGKLICSGSLSLAGIGQLAVTRFNSDGSLDPTFGVNGITIADIGTPNGEAARDIEMTPEGSILVCGGASMGSTDNALFARFLSGLETGMNEIDHTGMEMLVYPMPITGQATIRLGSTRPQIFNVDLLDTHGRVVQELIAGARITIGQGEYAIHPGPMSNGVYAIRCCTENGCLTRMVVITDGQ